MKRIALVAAAALFFFTTNAQTMKELTARLAEMEDKMAIKNLVDTFSILADVKKTSEQSLLFTEDGTSETTVNGQVISSLKGRKQLSDAFGAFLNLFETVYHNNGQHTITLHGDKATGITYCAVTLIGIENGRKMKTSIGACYHDEFIKQNKRWLIAHRKAAFAWQEKRPVAE